MYSGHYPRILIAPKNAQNTETKRQSGAVPILLLAISASMTSAYSSLGVSQGLTPNFSYSKRQSTTQPHQLCTIEVVGRSKDFHIVSEFCESMYLWDLPSMTVQSWEYLLHNCNCICYACTCIVHFFYRIGVVKPLLY
jgi:hypothetical protein